MKEVQAKRYAGPYEQIPFDNYIQSPIGLVPKDQGRKTRLIFHLSYPRGTGTSVNACIPKDYCTVKYPDFNDAVKMCLDEGRNAAMGKSDMSMAFRHVPMRVEDFRYLILKAYHPKTNKVYYFVDKCLPFGSSISCKHFQSISDCIAYVVSYRTKKPTLNYLDDYFFVALMKAGCDWQVDTFSGSLQRYKFPSITGENILGNNQINFFRYVAG